MEQGVLVHEMLGRFIEEAVTRAVESRLEQLNAEVDRRAQEAVEKACREMQSRVHHMVELGLRSLTTEGEEAVRFACERLAETGRKATEDLPVTIQEVMSQMLREHETTLRRRAENWMRQLEAESTASISASIETQFEASRKRVIAETSEAAHAICDRNLFDFRSEFENHVSRSFQSVADRLTAPLTLRPQ